MALIVGSPTLHNRNADVITLYGTIQQLLWGIHMASYRDEKYICAWPWSNVGHSECYPIRGRLADTAST